MKLSSEYSSSGGDWSHIGPCTDKNRSTISLKPVWPVKKAKMRSQESVSDPDLAGIGAWTDELLHLEQSDKNFSRPHPQGDTVLSRAEDEKRTEFDERRMGALEWFLVERQDCSVNERLFQASSSRIRTGDQLGSNKEAMDISTTIQSWEATAGERSQC